jgi:hypothetical protein
MTMTNLTFTNFLIYMNIGSRDSEGLRTGWLEFDSQECKIFLFSTASDSGAYPASYGMGTGDSFPGNKEAGA